MAETNETIDAISPAAKATRGQRRSPRRKNLLRLAAGHVRLSHGHHRVDASNASAGWLAKHAPERRTGPPRVARRLKGPVVLVERGGCVEAAPWPAGCATKVHTYVLSCWTHCSTRRRALEAPFGRTPPASSLRMPSARRTSTRHRTEPRELGQTPRSQGRSRPQG